MKALTQGEYDDLIAARDERDLLVRTFGVTSESDLQGAANALVALCDRAGCVLTVEQWSVPPLAMGNYKTIASVRKARGR